MKNRLAPYLSILFIVLAFAVACSARREATPGVYDIVYLTSRDASIEANSFRAPERLRTAVDARIAHTWDQVEAINDSQPIEALIIDASAQDIVEPEWLAAAYRRGVVVGTFNIYAPDVAALIGDPCVATDGFASEPYPGDFFVLAYRATAGPPADVARVEESYQTSCGAQPAQGVLGQVAASSGQAADELVLERHYNIFTQILQDMMQSVREAKQ